VVRNGVTDDRAQQVVGSILIKCKLCNLLELFWCEVVGV
jgi:hypothetical protein